MDGQDGRLVAPARTFCRAFVDARIRRRFGATVLTKPSIKDMTTDQPRYRSLSSWLKQTFGEPVRKIALDAGLGCPNRDGTKGSTGCLYCNARGSGTGAHAQGLSIAAQVDRSIAFLSRRYGCKKFIAYFQSFTNTYADVGRLAAIYTEALERPEIVGMSVGTRPDCVPDAVLGLLAELGRGKLVWIEYGLQSIHARTLRLIGRGHGPEAFWDACDRTRSRGLGVVAHLILGLPGESVTHMVQTVKAVAAAGVGGVKLHPLYVVRGAGLEKMALTGQYRPLSESDALDATFACIEALPRHVVIHRLTSDPHPDELVAPLWMRDRKGVRSRLEEAMERRNVIQGSQTSDPVASIPRTDSGRRVEYREG
jgi:uncharacterized protein